MLTQESIRKRQSIRSFDAKTIPPGLIEQLIDSGRLAPSARNIQPWEFIAITNKETLQDIGSLAENGRFIADAACCIAVFCADTKYYLEDGCAATENILITAADLGLAACWVAGDKKSYSSNIIDLVGAPNGYKLVSLISLGYASLPQTAPKKRPLKDVLHWERFGNHIRA